MGAEPHERSTAFSQHRRLLLLDDAVDAVAARRVENASVADPEGNVVSPLRRAVGHEISAAEVTLREPVTRLLLLVRVPRHEAPAGPERHVHEP